MGWLQIAWTVLMIAMAAVHVWGAISGVRAEVRAQAIKAEAWRKSAELQQEQYEITANPLTTQGTSHE